LLRVLLLALLLIFDGSTLLALGAAILVDLGATGNLAKAAFCSLLAVDALALNVIALVLSSWWQQPHGGKGHAQDG
jgi:hypothetical protein